MPTPKMRGASTGTRSMSRLFQSGRNTVTVAGAANKMSKAKPMANVAPKKTMGTVRTQGGRRSVYK